MALIPAFLGGEKPRFLTGLTAGFCSSRWYTHDWLGHGINPHSFSEVWNPQIIPAGSTGHSVPTASGTPTHDEPKFLHLRSGYKLYPHSHPTSDRRCYVAGLRVYGLVGMQSGHGRPNNAPTGATSRYIATSDNGRCGLASYRVYPDI